MTFFSHTKKYSRIKRHTKQMLYCVLFLIIISLILQLPARQWRNPWMAVVFLIFGLLLLFNNLLDGILVFLWYLFLISDYGRMFFKEDHTEDEQERFDTSSCNIMLAQGQSPQLMNIQTASDPRKAGWDQLQSSYNSAVSNGIFDPELTNEIQNVFNAEYGPQFRYNAVTDQFALS